MRCQSCGGRLDSTRSDMPFKLDRTRVVIIRDLPVLECAECGGYEITDAVMARVDKVLASVATSSELEVVRYEQDAMAAGE